MTSQQPQHNRSWKRYFKNKWFIGGLIVLVLIIILIARRGGSSSTLESAIVTKADVIERVSVTGKISAIDRADLAFEKSGSIAHIYKQVGFGVGRGELIASLNNADDEASLVSAQAKLADIARTLRPEELQVENARVETTRSALVNAKSSALNAWRNSYAQVQGAVVNYADPFFTNPQSSNPTIKIYVQSTPLQIAINNSRISVNDTLLKWQADIAAATSTDGVYDALSHAQAYLSTVKSFMNSLSSIVGSLNPSNSGLSQTIIDSYASSMNLALSGLNQASASLTSASSALDQAQSSYIEASSNFTLKNAGSSAEAIRAQQAVVNGLVATVAKGRIISPIDGIVTKADPKEGEFVPAGQTVFAVMSDGLYKIEAFVPEADIAKVTLGNHAVVTLDAYGSDVNFPATVTAIDPAETVIEGVSTYKVTLLFDQKDTRIRSGMTANTDILTRRHDAVLAIPSRAIIDVGGVKSVRIIHSDKKTYDTVPVSVGLKGSDGTSEIISGVAEGDTVVTYVK